MLFIIGVVVVCASVAGGYIMHGGVLGVLWQPSEFIIILGAAFGAFLIANSMHLVKETGKRLPRAILGQAVNDKVYLDLLSLLFDVFNKARREGMMSIEGDIESPAESGIFTQYPSILKDKRVIEFLADNLRIMTTSNMAPHEIEAMIDTEIETQMHELSEPAHAMHRIADGLPGFGIVAAILGIVITMQKLGGPPEALGASVAAALVGTFVGIFVAYGFIGPMSNRLQEVADAEIKMFECIKAAIVATSNGLPPQLAVEFARKTLYSGDRPSFFELEEHIRSR
ncbi:flagellar motor stator protein MotA [Pseudohongiella sp. SYSU M77423]|jgi:chemotaxis protein MotA|uniref:flagellar motor stator protein MotA n=1 Tax=unclassified Pseudohongiella TaxID=2629611 RepID=UPI000C8BE1F9|nr:MULTISPECIES: flagellar motor stator protein MotA [unclassified Pseudohongiella]MAY55031.1 flagellar motor stator protein MotA [Gammaproteobacteria bacterium]MDH7944165.1 flagellar motor stator protein MotA [Pseudohongiella sp. SYSU M77423]MEC8859371.1 flagellar motor stator protein MotA [Pseudomonadota bacterium]HBN13903.1 flagellar motor stator protein MotA [Pseudohongiella sp.]